MIIQGQADSLFPLSEGDANAKGIAAHGTPVKVVWYGGGHDGGLSESSRIRGLTLDWFDHYLKGRGKRQHPVRGHGHQRDAVGRRLRPEGIGTCRARHCPG